MIFNSFAKEVGPLISERRISDKVFYDFCKKFPELRLERDVRGKLIINTPVTEIEGEREGIAHGELYFWWKSNKITGKIHSPSTGFKLPDGSTRSADGSWTSEERMAVLSTKERNTFAQLVPDFIIEVRPKTDSLTKLKLKMKDTWIKNGVRLAWMIDPIKQKAYVYRADKSVEIINSFDFTLDGEEVCPNFQLALQLFRNN